MITAAQCRAARALINWQQIRLAKAAGVGVSTVRNFEAGKSEPMRQNVEAIARTLEDAGVSFDPDGANGPGVWLRRNP